MGESVFRVGDEVQALVTNPVGHTRLPNYVRGRRGRIESVRTAHPLPDETVRLARKGEPATVYGVAFTMEELWGPDAEPGSELVMELWEPYLRAVSVDATADATVDDDVER